ncbi:DUF4180 domain-containing protein [Paenibacillus sp. J31TS4]|uniref:DUF4180 domain-containing protein n=1 Tax=Paenibacillus sp. J31TS4 TaxID=2807195 RepID=UPI001BCB44A3|nr:DUF4180 domain-containing protein [Paenibacillus sp. J31TS4]
MHITKLETGGEPVAVVSGQETIIQDVQSALDLMANVRYETDCDRMIIPKLLVTELFFDLKTRLAGDILQKYTNYGMKVAFVGDFSVYASKSFRDFVYECNSGTDILFLPTEQEAIDRLSGRK